MSSDKCPDLSIVLPVYNEEDNVVPIHREIHEALQNTDLAYEIIFIDDGSTDSSVKRLREVQTNDPLTKVVVFRRNFGQTAAMAAGLDIAEGNVIVTMDADRQNDPADIPAMLKKLDEGYDMVCGWRHKRQDGFLLRLLPSIIANKIISSTTEVKLHDYGCTLKAIRKDVAKQIRLYGEMHRFIPAIASWIGVRIAEMKVNHRARTAGQSKYGISRTFRVILDLLTVKFLLGYSARPIQFFGTIGLASGFIGFLLCLWLGIQKLMFDIPLGDRPILLLAVMLVFIGLQFVTVGLLAEMQTRTYYESQGKRIYSIREIFHNPDTTVDD
ncbi:MAG: glycosyltransferase involved in cell wall biosynthesis [Gammaproteobacteria bacterium]|jgi:glycosyltransferase involved in cell wall biosynthesis